MTATMGRSSVTTPIAPGGHRWARSLAAPLGVGILGFLVSMIDITTPSLWYDEAATVISATRSWSQLWAELGNVDAVHGLYYGIMHLIFDAFGYSPLSLRMPSAIAAGIAAGLVVILGRQLQHPRAALIAGLVFCVMPRVTFMASEGRSYALSATLAALMTLALLRACRTGSRGVWLGYAAVAALGCVTFLYLTLVIIAHGITLLWLCSARQPSALRNARDWLIATVGAGLISLPVVTEVLSQSGQLSWIHPVDFDTILEVLESQWFDSSTALAITAWLCIILGIVALARRREHSILALLLPAIVVPTLALLLISALHMPIYQPRYLSMCTPFVALAIAFGIDTIRWRGAAPVALVLLTALAVPLIMAQREPEAKENGSWPQVAALIASQRAQNGPNSVAAIIYGPVWGHPKATARVIAYSYPEAFEGVIDVTIRTPAAETGQLWETRAPIAQSLDRLRDAEVSYLITSTSRDARAETTAALSAQGWEVTAAWNFTRVRVVRYDRG
ncbi:MAG: glycosyltransferase family 39 protein [Rhodoglobus sp.]